ISKGSPLPFDMMKGMFGKLKDAAKSLITSWLEEAQGGEGDAAWLLKHPIWQKFGSYTGGLGFNGGKHYGVDFGMKPGTDVKAVAGGKVSKVWNDYGGGKSIEVD
ncbi:M23 family metallopeptidase, partial [Staphylococcus nepalensis]|uniref:M23 family metallopeptidase n=1 Tax=Staphylococcus nepalensis TaxID=214473 RepID=UPI0022700735